MVNAVVLIGPVKQPVFLDILANTPTTGILNVSLARQLSVRPQLRKPPVLPVLRRPPALRRPPRQLQEPPAQQPQKPLAPPKRLQQRKAALQGSLLGPLQ
ncbi:hypothetical protein FRB91_008321 [Serendipita sp. 411]|nr:hypothetical protein FRB91_008321 [Serendipita sp. 411]